MDEQDRFAASGMKIGNGVTGDCTGFLFNSHHGCLIAGKNIVNASYLKVLPITMRRSTIIAIVQGLLRAKRTIHILEYPYD